MTRTLASVGCSVGRSVIISLKCGKFHWLTLLLPLLIHLLSFLIHHPLLLIFLPSFTYTSPLPLPFLLLLLITYTSPPLLPLVSSTSPPLTYILLFHYHDSLSDFLYFSSPPFLFGLSATNSLWRHQLCIWLQAFSVILTSSVLRIYTSILLPSIKNRHCLFHDHQFYENARTLFARCMVSLFVRW